MTVQEAATLEHRWTPRSIFNLFFRELFILPVDHVQNEEAAIMTGSDIPEGPPGMSRVEFTDSLPDDRKRCMRLLVRVTIFEAVIVGAAVGWRLWLR